MIFISPNDPYGLQEIITNQKEEIDRLQKRVAELEEKRDGWKINYDNLRAKYKERGERMKEMRDFIWMLFFKYHRDASNWFDEDGEPK